MQRINLNDFYLFGTALHVLTEIQPDKTAKEYFRAFNWARVWIDWFVRDRMIPMEVCKLPATRVLNEIDKFVPSQTNQVDPDKILSIGDLFGLVTAVRDFEIVFSAEASNKATYFVSKKGIYDTNDLIASADFIFTENARKHISTEARKDICEAGKCLAFDLATAAGFHIARAVERVTVDYLTVLSPVEFAKLKDGQRNLGGYIKFAQDNGGDKKICSSLDQFRDLHRNPLMHPEAVLTVDEAITLLGIAQSAIVAMVGQIEKLKTVGGTLLTAP